MTDKQIINGVDVSGPCKNRANCPFKQLKRKEQEYEELFKENNKLKQTLTEIEVIAMGIMDDDLEESSAYYDAKQILQKIRKCEEENERN